MFFHSSEELCKRFSELLVLKEKEKNFVLSFLRKFSRREDLFLVGGCVRALFTGERIKDIDIAVKEDIVKLADFGSRYLRFTLVPLSHKFGIYRLAKGDFSIDFTLFRGETIEEDLFKRDFTINAIACPVRCLFEGSVRFVDPLGGIEDLKKGIIKAIAEENIEEDPLRILRGYRFFAQDLGKLEEKTREYFKKHAKRLILCARERILYELSLILLSEKSYETFRMMEEDKVLEVIFPYLEECKGVEQPSFHHLDVFGHLMESLKWAEEILKEPEKYLGISLKEKREDKDFIMGVKLASFFHDLGKARTYKEDEKKGRITFYQHEKVSALLFEEMAEELRFKNELIEFVINLIRNHMRPFHLLNEREKGKLTVRAKRNLIKDVKSLEGLFVVAMADSLASQGPDKEPDYEEKLKEFFHELLRFKNEFEKEVRVKRIITGHDLIALGFKPGPIFKKILQDVEVKFLEKKIRSKEEALEYVKEKYGKRL